MYTRSQYLPAGGVGCRGFMGHWAFGLHGRRVWQGSRKVPHIFLSLFFHFYKSFEAYTGTPSTFLGSLIINKYTENKEIRKEDQ